MPTDVNLYFLERIVSLRRDISPFPHSPILTRVFCHNVIQMSSSLEFLLFRSFSIESPNEDQLSKISRFLPFLKEFEKGLETRKSISIVH